MSDPEHPQHFAISMRSESGVNAIELHRCASEASQQESHKVVVPLSFRASHGKRSSKTRSENSDHAAGTALPRPLAAQVHGRALPLALLIAHCLLLPVLAQAQTAQDNDNSNVCRQSESCLMLRASLARTTVGRQTYAFDPADYGDVTVNQTVNRRGADGAMATRVLASDAPAGIINPHPPKADGDGVGVMSTLLAGSRLANGVGLISTSRNSSGPDPSGVVAAARSSVPPPIVAASVTRDIVTDFGAKCDGVADDTRAFAAFNIWARAQTRPVVLTIPSWRTCTFKSYNAVGSYFAKGIKKLLVIGYGATLSDGNGTGIFSLAGVGQYSDNQHSARLETVYAGSSTVVLKSSAQHRLFSVGSWALITGYDLQGHWKAPYGYPSNPHYFEYVQIIDKNADTGVIRFASPVKNTYRSTWPRYNSGSRSEVDNGGPATLYALDPSWDTEVEYRGLTIQKPTAQTYANGRSVTYRDVTFTGTGGAIPTSNRLWQLINCTLPNVDMEGDKLVTSIVVIGSTLKNMNFQSSSIDVLTMDSSTITGNLLGTPKNAVISNSSINALYPGAYSYGRSDEFVCTNCIIRSINLGGRLYKGPNDAGMDSYFGMSNGVITIPNIYGAFAANWAVPGTHVVWQDNDRTSISMFRVIDVTQDDNNIYVQTNQAGGFPRYNGKLFVRTHPAPKITITNSSGVAPAGTNDGSDAYYLSQAPPGAPLYSYSKRLYDGSVVESLSWPVWGNLVSLKIDVKKAYSGGHRKMTFSPLGPYCWTTKPSDGSLYNYVPIIDLRTPKDRTITPISVTGSRAGDAIPFLPEVPLWFANAIRPHMNVDIRGENPSVWPSVTVEIITDQGVAGP
jgi:hypothetical protein